jgi:hypothetical protein
MQKIPSEYKNLFRQLRSTVAAEMKNTSFEFSTPEVNLARMRQSAHAYFSNDYPPQIQLAMERILLELQWAYVISLTDNCELLEAIIARYEEIGYESPTLWGRLRCHLADMLECNGRKEDARRLRKEVETEYVRVVDMFENFIFCRVRNH